MVKIGFMVIPLEISTLSIFTVKVNFCAHKNSVQVEFMSMELNVVSEEEYFA